MRDSWSRKYIYAGKPTSKWKIQCQMLSLYSVLSVIIQKWLTLFSLSLWFYMHHRHTHYICTFCIYIFIWSTQNPILKGFFCYPKTHFPGAHVAPELDKMDTFEVRSSLMRLLCHQRRLQICSVTSTRWNLVTSISRGHE